MSATDKAAGKLWASQICQTSLTKLQTNAGIDEVVEFLSRKSANDTDDYKAGVQELIDSINGAKK